MPKARFKSDAFEAIHGAASGLARSGVVDKQTMREFDELCLAKAPCFGGKAIARIRKDAKVSQPVFGNT